MILSLAVPLHVFILNGAHPQTSDELKQLRLLPHTMSQDLAQVSGVTYISNATPIQGAKSNLGEDLQTTILDYSSYCRNWVNGTSILREYPCG